MAAMARFASDAPPVTAHRKLSRGASQATYSPADAEGFHGRFSTAAQSPQHRTSDSFPGWMEKIGGSWKDSLKGRWQILIMLIVAFDLVFGVIQPFVAEPMRVPSGSMAPTLQPHDSVLTNKLAYDFSPPERGDIAVFENPGEKGQNKLVKRVVGLPGDRIQVEDGVLLVNGAPPYEPYKKHRPGEPEPKNDRKAAAADAYGPVTVPEGHVFVLGDNRNDSYDSRYLGPVPQENLIGEVTLLLWPPSRLGTP